MDKKRWIRVVDVIILNSSGGVKSNQVGKDLKSSMYH